MSPNPGLLTPLGDDSRRARDGTWLSRVGESEGSPRWCSFFSKLILRLCGDRSRDLLRLRLALLLHRRWVWPFLLQKVHCPDLGLCKVRGGAFTLHPVACRIWGRTFLCASTILQNYISRLTDGDFEAFERLAVELCDRFFGVGLAGKFDESEVFLKEVSNK